MLSPQSHVWHFEHHNVRWMYLTLGTKGLELDAGGAGAMAPSLVALVTWHRGFVHT
jgi:hypothetical protein